MALLKHIHRDMLNRVIKIGDIVVWGNGKYLQKMEICRVVGTTAQKVSMQVISSGSLTRALPSNMIVISAQIAQNLEGNVGANIDLEESR